jgi:hypothetical protein
LAGTVRVAVFSTYSAVDHRQRNKVIQHSSRRSPLRFESDSESALCPLSPLEADMQPAPRQIRFVPNPVGSVSASRHWPPHAGRPAACCPNTSQTSVPIRGQ